MYVAESNGFAHSCTFSEVGLGLTREADNHIRCYVKTRNSLLYPVAHVAELCGCIVAMHVAQGVFGSTLKADVHVRSELWVLEQAQKTVAEVVGLDR